MKKIIIFLLSPIIFCFLSSPAHAESLVFIDKSGDVVWKVLSSSDAFSLDIDLPSKEDIKITDVINIGEAEDSLITLGKKDGKISLSINSMTEGTKSLDVTNWQDDLIEVEERGESQKLAIKVIDGKFNLEQEGISVVTEYPINIDPKKNEISVEAPSGNKFLSILPIDAVRLALRSKAMTRFSGPQAALVEEEAGDLVYVLNGEKVINFFRVLDYPVEVQTKISVLTGEITYIKQPSWLKVLSFLLS